MTNQSSQRPRHTWSRWSALVALAVMAVIVVSRWQGWFEALERNGFDFLIRIRGSLPADDRIILAEIDDATLAWLGHQPPIPRRVLAQLVDRAAAGGANLIVLDALLSERQTAAQDAALVESIRNAGNVILASSLKTGSTSDILPLPDFLNAALDTGYANLPIDSDGFVRRDSLFEPAAKVRDYSLATRAVTNFLGAPLEFDRTQIQFHLGGMKLQGPTELRPEIIINYRGPSPHFPRVSAHDLLTQNQTPTEFKDKIVMVGQSFTLAPDLFQTPFFKPLFSGKERLMPGMEVHASAISTLLDNNAIVPVHRRTQIALDLFCLAIAFLALMFLSPARGLGVIAASVVLVFAASAYRFSHNQVWNRFVSQEVAIIALTGATLGVRYTEERRARRFITLERQKLMGLFERYVSPEIATQIWDHRDEIMLHGQTLTTTILFSDIRNFTAMSEGRPSQEILALLNDYFEGMNSIVKAHQGFINKYIGDGLMVLYGVPFSDDATADARRAVASGLAMIKAVKEKQTAGLWPFSVGVGIHTGIVSAGNIGARDRIEYSVIGETVNLASRLESLNKEYHTQLIISEETLALVAEFFRTRKLGQAEVKGFHRPIPIYEVLGERMTD